MLILFGVPGNGSAQQQYSWRGVDLHPPGATESRAWAVGNSTPAGYVWFEDPPRFYGPASWPGCKLPFRDLTPPGADSGSVEGASGNVQGGWAHVGGIWQGTADSFIDLSPGLVSDVAGNQQVGHVYINGMAHAILWRDANPFTYLDLHPAGAERSKALATDGLWQGGYVTGLHSGYETAALWKGLHTLFTDMHPPQSRASHIEGMAPGAQVGWATRDGSFNFDNHAILWRGTPESWINMHPSFYPGDDSYLYGTTGDMHVGHAEADAGIWFGDDPDSFHNLERYLPGATGSAAYDIEVYNGKVYIAGYASYNSRPHATVWIGTAIAPGDPPEPRSPTRAIKRRP